MLVLHKNENKISSYLVSSSRPPSHTGLARAWHSGPAGWWPSGRLHPWRARTSHRRSWSARLCRMQPTFSNVSLCFHKPFQHTDNAIHYKTKKTNRKPIPLEWYKIKLKMYYTADPWLYLYRLYSKLIYLFWIYNKLPFKVTEHMNTPYYWLLRAALKH